MKTQRPVRESGFTLLECVIIAAVLAVLMGLYLPAMLWPRRCTSCAPNCVNNLKMVGLAFSQWALDNGDKYPMQVSVTNGGTMEWVGSRPVYFHFLVMSNELNTPKILFCPQESDSQRQPAVTFFPSPGLGASQVPLTNDLNLSYFVGVDAHDRQPSMFLAGDRHLSAGGKPLPPGLVELWTNGPVAWAKPVRSRHNDGGNIALADGSVQSLNDAQLRLALAMTGKATNRLAMP
jgi:prepilin-type processing-associated H-X9-DG protein